MTLSIPKLRIKTFRITIHLIIILSIMTLSTTIKNVILSITALGILTHDAYDQCSLC